MKNTNDNKYFFMSDEDVWQSMNQYEKEERKGSRILMAGGFLLMLGMAYGVASQKVLLAVPFLILGIVFFTLGMRYSRRANDSKNQLIHQQLGPYAEREYEQQIGSFSQMDSKKEFRQLVEAANLFARWNRFEGSNFIEGDYGDFHYQTGNVHLIFAEEGCDRGDDLDLEIKYIDRFQGIWMHIIFPHPVTEENLQYLDGLKDFSEGEIYKKAQGCHLDLALETPFRIYSFQAGIPTESFGDLKNAFRINLAYEKRILDGIAACEKK